MESCWDHQRLTLLNPPMVCNKDKYRIVEISLIPRIPEELSERPVGIVEGI